MNIAMTAADITKWIALGPISISEIFGYNNQATDLYIQLHENPVVANTDVPNAKGLLCQSAFMFRHSWPKPLTLSELTLAVSTSEANLTKVLAAGGLDLTLVGETTNPVTGQETITGDLATGVDSRTPFADAVAQAGKKLLRVDFTNNDGGNRWLMLFADPTAALGAKPLWQSPVIANGAKYTGRFGAEGRKVFSQDSTAGRLPHYGCFLAQSSTAVTLTPTVSAASYIRAITRDR